jgi:hypothetical protein
LAGNRNIKTTGTSHHRGPGMMVVSSVYCGDMKQRIASFLREKTFMIFFPLFFGKRCEEVKRDLND